MRRTLFSLSVALLCLAAGSETFAMASFNKAKEVLPGLYRSLDRPVTLYCGCPIAFDGNYYYPVMKKCLQDSGLDEDRPRLNVEHIVPAWRLGQNGERQCWLEGKRNNCTRTDKRFSLMEGDLHNQAYVIRAANDERGHAEFGEAAGKSAKTRTCALRYWQTSQGEMAEPPAEAKGIIARAYLYMAKEYGTDGMKLTKREKKLYKAWNEKYPPDESECQRNALIEEIQGNDNPFITEKCGKR